MVLTKVCVVCEKEFPKPYYCSYPEWEKRKFCSQACKHIYQVGKPTGKKKTGLGSMNGKFEPCRICGNPTKYYANKKYENKVHCEKIECIEESKRLKNQKISSTHLKDYKTNKREKLRDNWDSIKRISKEEEVIAEFMISIGYIQQFVLPTKLPNGAYPRSYSLDFANVSSKLNVEIDGSSHKLEGRKERDELRDSILISLGWKTLRLPSELINRDLEEAKSLILKFNSTKLWM